MNVLFVCGRNRLRSPTAEEVFSAHPEVRVASAGVNPDADTTLTPELVAWADLIFVMERTHGQKLKKRFGQALGSTRVICLDIADRYGYMDPTLIALLQRRVRPHLRSPPGARPRA